MKKQVTNAAGKTTQPEVMKNYLMVAPSSIIIDEKENPRTDYGNIEELMHSVLENGILIPLKVYLKDGKYYLKGGFRRMRAVNLALSKGHKIERVPVITEERSLNAEERTLEHIVHNDGKPLTMMEQAEVIRRLLNFKWKPADIARKTGKARGYIENLILLTNAPMAVQNYIREGKISAHAVIQIMQAMKGDADKVVKEVEEAIKNAADAGKGKATPKHVGAKKVKSQNFGKFYKFVEAIADELAGRKDVLREREEVLTKLMVGFENGQKPETVAGYFLNRVHTPPVEKPAAGNGKKK